MRRCVRQADSNAQRSKRKLSWLSSATRMTGGEPIYDDTFEDLKTVVRGVGLNYTPPEGVPYGVKYPFLFNFHGNPLGTITTAQLILYDAACLLHSGIRAVRPKCGKHYIQRISLESYGNSTGSVGGY